MFLFDDGSTVFCFDKLKKRYPAVVEELRAKGAACEIWEVSGGERQSLFYLHDPVAGF